MKKIELRFDKKFTHIAGNDYGYEIYCDQIRDFFDGKEKLEIWFPDYIEGVSISFVQGLIKDMLKIVTKDKLLGLIELHSNSDFLDKRLYDNLRF